jgi:hypothetical protein
VYSGGDLVTVILMPNQTMASLAIRIVGFKKTPPNAFRQQVCFLRYGGAGAAVRKCSQRAGIIATNSREPVRLSTLSYCLPRVFVNALDLPSVRVSGQLE